MTEPLELSFRESRATLFGLVGDLQARCDTFPSPWPETIYKETVFSCYTDPLQIRNKPVTIWIGLIDPDRSYYPQAHQHSHHCSFHPLIQYEIPRDGDVLIGNF